MAGSTGGTVARGGWAAETGTAASIRDAGRRRRCSGACNGQRCSGDAPREGGVTPGHEHGHDDTRDGRCGRHRPAGKRVCHLVHAQRSERIWPLRRRLRHAEQSIGEALLPPGRGAVTSVTARGRTTCDVSTIHGERGARSHWEGSLEAGCAHASGENIAASRRCRRGTVRRRRMAGPAARQCTTHGRYPNNTKRRGRPATGYRPPKRLSQPATAAGVAPRAGRPPRVRRPAAPPLDRRRPRRSLRPHAEASRPRAIRAPCRPHAHCTSRHRRSAT